MNEGIQEAQETQEEKPEKYDIGKIERNVFQG